MKRSRFIFITILLICNSIFLSCSDSNSQKLSTELQEDSSWQTTIGPQHFRRLPSFDCLRDGSILWRNKSKGDWMIRYYEQPYQEKQVRFGSDNNVELRLKQYVKDLVASKNSSEQNTFINLPVTHQDQRYAIKLHNILDTEPSNLNKATREQLQNELTKFMCCNIEYLINKHPKKNDSIPWNNQRRHESHLHIQSAFNQLPPHAQNLIKSKYE